MLRVSCLCDVTLNFVFFLSFFDNVQRGKGSPESEKKVVLYYQRLRSRSGLSRIDEGEEEDEVFRLLRGVAKGAGEEGLTPVLFAVLRSRVKSEIHSDRPCLYQSACL